MPSQIPTNMQSSLPSGSISVEPSIQPTLQNNPAQTPSALPSQFPSNNNDRGISDISIGIQQPPNNNWRQPAPENGDNRRVTVLAVVFGFIGFLIIATGTLFGLQTKRKLRMQEEEKRNRSDRFNVSVEEG